MNDCSRVALLFVVLSLGFAAPAFAVETPMTMLELMGRLESAERELSFRGHVTHEHDGAIDSFEFVRIVINGIEYEKTSKLSGSEREKVNIGRDTNCLTKSNHLLRGHNLNLKLGGAVSLDQSYDFYFLGEDRVADRDVFVVRIEPKDSFRYGYWFSIDKASGLVVRSVITLGKKKALERAQFVYVEELQGDKLVYLSEQELADINARAQRKNEGQLPCDINVKRTSPWRPSWVPPGFLLTSYSYTDEDGHMETYSDGLGVFSVFVNDFSGQQSRRLLANSGATVALLSHVSAPDAALNVSVVGEIPLLAAQKISASVIAVSVSEE